MQLLYTTIIIIVTRCKVYNKKKKNELYENGKISKKKSTTLYVRKGEKNLVES